MFVIHVSSRRQDIRLCMAAAKTSLSTFKEKNCPHLCLLPPPHQRIWIAAQPFIFFVHTSHRIDNFYQSTIERSRGSRQSFALRVRSGTQWPPKSKCKNTLHILKTSSISINVFQVTETFSTTKNAF